ncbi:MAG TPA: sulfurtransferase TusA family protein [Anaeromyxobacter sp.]
MADEIKVNQTLDAKGMNCPIPILKTKRALDGMAKDQILKVLTTDPGSQKDMPAWANRTGNVILHVDQAPGLFTFYIQKT